MRDPRVRILLLDDELSLREPLQKYLQGQFGYHVDTAAHGKEALQKIVAAQGGYDVALIDQTLTPGPDGIEVMRRIKDSYSNIECIIFTGWGSESRQRALEAGAFRYLEKPVNPDELAMLIRSAAQQVRLKAISHAILRELDQEQVLSLIAEAAQSLAAADDAAIVLLDRDTKRLKIQNLATSARWKRHLNQKTLTRDIIESGKISPIADLEKLQDVNPQLIACGYRSLVGIPIPGHEGSLGVLYTYSRTANHFEQWGRTTVLQTLADQAGLAIANAQAYEQVRKHAGFMESLVKAAEGLTRTTDESGQLSLAWDFIREQLHVKTFFIALYNRETDTLRFALAYDEDKKIDIPSRQLGEDRSTWGIAGHAVKSGQELNWRTTLEKEEQCRTLDIAPQQFGKSCKSCFCFPIRSGSEIIGALSLQDYREHAFTSPQLAACRALGSQLAVALENTRLLASIQHASRRADALNQVVLDLSKEQDRRSLMQAIIREARALTEAEGGAIYLLDPAGQQFKMEAGVALPEELEGQLSSKQDGIKGFILETGKPQAVSDYYRWERRIRGLDALHLTAVAGAPIQVGMHILGAIIVHSTKPDDRFRDDDLLLLQQLANHAGLAIQKATLLDRLKAIQELSTSIASTADSSSIFTSVCKEAVELFGADHSGMVLFEPELTHGIVKAEYPANLKTIGLTIPVTGVQAELGVAIHQKPLVLEHLEGARQELGPVYDILHGLGIQSILIVPIVYQNRVLGSFSLDAIEHPRAFTEQEVELCKVFASHVAVAIENARLFEETSRRERLLDALAQASLNIRAEQDTPTFLHQVVRSAVQLLDSDAGCILIRHPHLGEVEVAGVCELPEAMLGKRIPQTEGIIGLIISSGEPKVIHEYATWSERCAIHTQTGLKSVIGVPLRIGGEIEAVLMVGTITAERPFSQTDIEVLGRFAQQAALTLHSSRLMTQEQRILSQLGFLRRISDSIQAARNLDQILHMVLTGVTAGYGFGFNRAAIFLAEGATDQLIGRMGIGRMTEREAQLDWEEHRRQGRENIDVYMRLLAEDALEPTPVDKRVRGLVLPITAGSPLEMVLRQGDCLRLNDADMDILPPDVRAAFEPASPLIVAPLRAQEEVIGILIADNRFTRAPITDDLVEALLTFVNTAVIAIQNAELLKSLQEEKSRLSALYAASNAVTLSPDPVQTLEASVEHARIAAKAHGVSMILISPAGTVRKLVTAGADQRVPADELVRPDGLSMTVMRSGQYQKIEDAMVERQHGNPSLIKRGIGAALCLPVAVEGERFGVMWFHYKQPRRFPDSEVEAYQFYTDQAALVYAGARELQTLERMRRAAAAFATAEDEQEILQQIVQHGCEVMQAKLATVWPYDDARDYFLPDQFTSCGLQQEWMAEAKRYPPRSGQVSETILRDGWMAFEDLGNQKSLELLGETRQSLLLKSGTKSLLGEALLVGDEKLGVLYFGFETPRSFKERELETARSFTHQAALAIKNARLMAEVRRTKDNAVFVAKTSALAELPQVLQAIVTGIQDVLRSDTVTIYAYNSERDEFVFPPAMVGVRDEASVLKLRHVEGKSIVGKVLLLDSRHIAEDAQTDPIFSKGKFVFRENIISSIGLPLRTRDQKVGVLFICYRVSHTFSQEELSTIELFANQAAVAIHNALLFANEQNHVRVLAAIQTAATDVSGLLEPQTLLPRIAEQAARAFDAPATSLMQWDINAENLVVTAQFGVSDAYKAQSIPIAAVLDIIGKHPEQIDPVYIEDLRKKHYGSKDLIEAEGLRSSLTIPLLAQNNLIGILNIYSRNLTRHFTRQEIKLARVFAAQVVIALQNARSYSERMQQADALRALNGAGQAITSALTLPQTLDQIVYQALELVGGEEAEGCFSHLSLKTGNWLRFTAASRPDILVYLQEQVGDIDLSSEYVGITGTVGISGKSLRVDDVKQYVREGGSYIVLNERTNSELCVPISISSQEGRRVIGVINVEHPDHGAFNHEDQLALESLSAQAAIAIQNARLYDQQRIVQEISQETARQLDFDTCLYTLFRKLVGVFKERRLEVFPSLATYDATTKTLSTRLTEFYSNEPRIVHQSIDDQGLVPLVARSKEPYYSRDVATDPNYLGLRDGTHSEIAVPIIFGTELIGVLDVECSVIDPFEQEDIALLRILAGQLATILHNIQQYDELDRTKQLMAARASIAWVGMVGSVWRHTIDKHALTIREASDLIRNELKSSTRDPEVINNWLEIIERKAAQILEKPLTPPLSAEEGVSSVFVNSFLRERVERMWTSDPYKSCPVTLDLILDERSTIRASVEWLRRLLEILLDNAINAMADTPQPALVIGSRMIGHSAEIIVADVGCGIPDATRKILFQQPVEKPQGSTGLGIGLLLAQMIAQTYDGHVRVESTSDQGTTMVVAFPLE